MSKSMQFAPEKDGGGTPFPVSDIMLPMKDTYNGNILIKRAHVKSEITFEHMQEQIKCARDPIYFIENYCRIVSLDDGIVPFKLYDYQREMIHMYVNNRFNLTLTARQMGKTATMAAYILWFAIFNPTKYIAVLANKMDQAQEIMDRIRMSYEYLPFFLQHGVTTYNKRRVAFDNGSIIFSAATSASSIRGRSVDLVYIDEAAFIENDLTFYESTYPVITSGKDSRVIMTSTPRGARGMFYNLYRESQANRNYYKTLEVIWDKHPKRDEEWKKVTIANIGYSRFQQEFSCVGYNTEITIQEKNDFEFKISVGDANKLLEDDKHIVYEHISPSGKSYIGKTKFSIRYRWKEHTYAALVKNSNFTFHIAIRKYGSDNWQHKILGVYDSNELASKYEKLFISDAPKRSLYNGTKGGEGTVGVTNVIDASGNIISIKVDDPRFLSGELKSIVCGTKKMVEISTGNILTVSINDSRIKDGELKPLHEGMKRSKESKQRMSESAKLRGSNNTGYQHNDETKLNMSKWQKGKSKTFNDQQVEDIISRYKNRELMSKEGYRCPKSGTIKGYHSSFCEALAFEYNVKSSAISSTISTMGVERW